jgi:hypothetical protein
MGELVKGLRKAGAKDIIYKRYDDGAGHGAYVNHIKEASGLSRSDVEEIALIFSAGQIPHARVVGAVLLAIGLGQPGL